MQGLQLNLPLADCFIFFDPLAFTESVNKASKKETRAGTHVSFYLDRKVPSLFVSGPE